MRPAVSSRVSSPFCVRLYVSACKHRLPAFGVSAQHSVAVTAHYSGPKIVAKIIVPGSLMTQFETRAHVALQKRGFACVCKVTRSVFPSARPL